MLVKLTCPVCDRSQIETNICPNCETDLSTYRMLAQLPLETSITVKEAKQNIPLWLPVSIAILFLLLGIGLGFGSNSFIAQQQSQNTSTSSTPPNPISETVSSTALNKSQETEKSQACDGFNYVVQKGDSLSLIASNFYGDSNSWSWITDANPKLQGRESFIKIDEILLVPNRKTYHFNH
ncbi:hypothetical protein NIES4102_14920 [Chondrocystis sp. NIES-4102]|nr:hypothetical protein NIES4102_14920 [Chondrocystis sp. NIES-4102]